MFSLDNKEQQAEEGAAEYY